MAREQASVDTGDGVVSLDRGWLFGGPTSAGATLPGFDDRAFARVTLPHANATLPWRDLDRSRYQYVAIYRRHFTPPAAWRGRRVFVEFDGAMAAATVTINGHRFAEHRGGYTPFSRELTDHLDWSGDNVLAVEVDARRSRADFPPFGGRFPDGRERLDYDTFGGIGRGARLRAVPPTFIENVRATPFDVLAAAPGLAVRCFLAGDGGSGLAIAAELRDGERILGRADAPVAPSAATLDLTLGDLAGIHLWGVDAPHLHELIVTLRDADTPIQEWRARVGFREARFEPDGFFLNGRRVPIVGLNRHELFPYVGGAMPPRVQRRDALILRRELGCNMARMAHYPQSPAFLDACDELGLLVWEELPGWQHVGDDEWRAVAAENVGEMIRRDWNRPSVVLWGVRVNESANDEPNFFDALHRLARDLDPSRQTVGAHNKREHPRRTDVWGENDYGLHGEPLGPPHRAAPYLISEAVGQKRPGGDFTQFYRRRDPDRTLQLQAERHAAVLDAAAGDPRYAGVLAWCAFEYNSPFNGDAGVKTPGVADLFRIPKAAGFLYRAQRPPADGIVLEPAFGWGFGPGDPSDGPGAGSMICANCDRLELFVDGAHVATALPDRARFPHLAHPPFFVDLTADGAALPELRIDGHLGDRLAISRSFSADRAADRLDLAADDAELAGDGADATRLVVRAVDRYGNPRARATGAVRFTIAGLGAIVGDNPFDLGPAGGAGAVWVRADDGATGTIRVRASHPTLGEAGVTIAVAPAPPVVI